MEAGSAPLPWWRPALSVVCLLDTALTGARPPVGAIGGTAALLVPALLRCPDTQLLTLPGVAGPSAGQVRRMTEFTGHTPTMAALGACQPGSFGTIVWLQPKAQLVASQAHQLAGLLAPDGMLAVAGERWSADGHDRCSLFRARSALRRRGWRLTETIGFHSQRAVLWSALGRAATATGRLDLYDRCHAAMRRDFMECWPAAALCTWWLVRARRRPTAQAARSTTAAVDGRWPGS